MAQPKSSTPFDNPVNQVQTVIVVEEYREQLEKWTRKSRRKADFPRRLKARLIALHYFQIAFDPEQQYSEPQVNAAIQRGNIFETDHVQIRRYLVDYGMLRRSANGRTYSVSDKYISLAECDTVILDHRLKPPSNLLVGHINRS